MEREIAGLQRALLSAEGIDLARGALVAGGVRTVRELDRCLAALERLQRLIAADIGDTGDGLGRAAAIFRWLWRAKPRRYHRGGSFRLDRVLDAQLGEGQDIGNCLGLTLLYNALAARFGLAARAAYLEDAFGLGPHVCTTLDCGQGAIDIENMMADGFDYKGHRNAPGRQQWGDRQLIADIYHSAASELFTRGALDIAVEGYDMALALNPQHPGARMNRGIALVALGKTAEAAEWFSQWWP